MRRFVLVVAGAIALSLCAVAPAQGGDYSVNACTTSTGSTKSWLPVQTQAARLLVFCFGSVPGTMGMLMVPGNYAPGRYVPEGVLGGWRIHAPSGTQIVSVSGSIQHVDRGGALVADISETQDGPTLMPLPSHPGAAWIPFSLPQTQVSSAWLRLRCARQSCLYDSATFETASFKDLVVRLRDVTPPTITPPSSLERWYSTGAAQVEFTAADNVGLTEFRAAVDGTERLRSDLPCYWPTSNALLQPCFDANRVLRGGIDVSSMRNGEHGVTLRATDPGGLTTTRTFRLRVDHIPPNSPRRLSLIGGDHWRAENRFNITWSNPPTDGLAPVTAVEYSFCPASNAAYETAGCLTQARAIDPTTDAGSVAVPGDGIWTLRVGLRDAAGNFDPAQLATVEPLRLDREPPTGTILPIDPVDPTRIRVSAQDPTSGVARVEVEARRVGDDAWRSVAASRDGGLFSAVADDSVLPGGEYDVRARLIDLADNERTIASETRLRLPARAGGTLSAGRPVREKVRGKKTKFRTKLEDSTTVGFGTAVTIEGSLKDPAGNPRSGAALDVTEMIGNDGQWRPVSSTTTGPTGGFTVQSPPGSSRRVRIVFAGNATERPLAKEVDIRVRAGITIRSDRRRVRNGQRIVFHGALRGGPVPSTGKLLSLQALTTRGWRTFATPRARAKDGRWSSTYRFTGTSVRTRYAFRIVVPAESGYPYERGTSSTAKVLVTP